MGVAFVIGFMVVLGVPLVLCLNAMGRQIRADFERGQPDRIATDVQLQRKLLMALSVLVLLAFVLGRWMIGLTALLTGLAFLIPYWRNRPTSTAD